MYASDSISLGFQGADSNPNYATLSFQLILSLNLKPKLS